MVTNPPTNDGELPLPLAIAPSFNLPPPVACKIKCSFFLKGSCRNGTACKFMHYVSTSFSVFSFSVFRFDFPYVIVCSSLLGHEVLVNSKFEV